MNVGDDENFLEKMIESDEGVGEEENGFWHSNRVGEIFLGLGFEVLHAIVRNVSDRST